MSLKINLSNVNKIYDCVPMIARHSSSNLALSVDPSRKMYKELINLDFTYANSACIKNCSNVKKQQKKTKQDHVC